MMLSEIVRDMARAARIPDELIPSVVERALAARHAVELARQYRIGRARRPPPLSSLAFWVVCRAVVDHRKGRLERVCRG